MNLIPVLILAFGLGPSAQDPKPITQMEVVADQLFLDVYDQEFPTAKGPISCWTFVSKGLNVYKQKEIVISVRKYPELGEPKDQIDIKACYKYIFEQAIAGNIVNEYGRTRFGGEFWLLRKKSLRSLLYFPGFMAKGAVYPTGPFLTALILHDAEYDTMERYGATRVMTLIGMAYDYYPTVPFNDNQRQALIHPDEMRTSLLNTLQGIFYYTMSIARYSKVTDPEKGERMVWTLAPNTSKKILSFITNEELAHVFFTGLDSSADSALAWKDGQTSLQSIAFEGSKQHVLAGCFFTLLPSENTQAVMREDGFAMLLSPDDWAATITALADEKPLFLPSADGGMGFEIRFDSEEYKDPFTGETLILEQGGRRYTAIPNSTNKAEKKSKHPAVELELLVFLTEDKILNFAVETDQYAAYLHQILHQVEQLIPKENAGAWREMVVQTELGTDGTATYEISPELHEQCPQLTGMLEKVETPPSKGYMVKSQLRLKVRGAKLPTEPTDTGR